MNTTCYKRNEDGTVDEAVLMFGARLPKGYQFEPIVGGVKLEEIPPPDVPIGEYEQFMADPIFEKYPNIRTLVLRSAGLE